MDESPVSASGSASTPLKSDDPAWAHGQLVPGKRNNTICLYCKKHLAGGGITRLKEHLAGIKGNVTPCKSAPEEVKWQMKNLLPGWKSNQARKSIRNCEFGDGYPLEEEEEVEEVGMETPPSNRSVRTSRGKEPCSNEGAKKRKMQNIGPPRTSPVYQLSTGSAPVTEETLREAHLCVARWWYDANISFNAAQSKYYQPMWDAVTSIGPRYKGPSLHELRGALLKHIVQEIECYLIDIKASWATYGCSIMADGWTNQHIINFFIHCPKGTMFLKSIDTSGLTKDANTLFEMFDEVVKVVGPHHVVQFITYNDAAYKAAGKMLMTKYDTIFWSPCAAHCIDLILDSFSKPNQFPTIHATIQKARKITKFIYNHGWVLALMRREFTNGRDLCRPGVTRFATHFLSLQCLLMFKKELRKMFTCDKWVDSQYAKTGGGKVVQSIILEDREFWSICQHVVKVTEPLVKVLRLVDGDEKPTMGYLFEAMDNAKETIKARLKNKLSQYLPYTRIIEHRWANQLHSPLHAAGCMLNPGIFFRPSFTKQREVTRGFMTVITRLVPDFDVQEKISEQLESYKNSIGEFGIPLAIRQRERLNPVAWWEQFGNECPHLQKFALRILSQCTSATGCERNWSTFEFIHSKKRNRLERQRLDDLVFVRYNLKLRERNDQRGRQAPDPINIEHIDIMEDWVSEEPSLLEKDDFEKDWESIDLPLQKFANLGIQDDIEVVFDEEEIQIPENESQWELIRQQQDVLALSDDENVQV